MRAIDALIERAARGRASAADLAWLAAWRRGSPARARRCRQVAQLIDAARTLDATAPATRRPRAAEIVARVRER